MAEALVLPGMDAGAALQIELPKAVARRAAAAEPRPAAPSPLSLARVEVYMGMFYTAGSESEEYEMTQGTVQIVAGVLAVLLIAIIFMRRKSKKKRTDEEEF